MADGPIHACIERWHDALRGDLATGLDELLHPDCTFTSPVLFRPQHGADLTKMYLLGAYGTFNGASPAQESAASSPADADGLGTASGFRYVRRVLDGHDAVLEFEATIDGVVINGADFITCDDDGRITDFKVMIRPLRAVEKMRDLMAAMLEALPTPAEG